MGLPCKAIVCQEGTAHCINGQCQCTVFQTKTSCSNDFECNKKFDPKCNVHSYVNGLCVCGFTV